MKINLKFVPPADMLRILAECDAAERWLVGEFCTDRNIDEQFLSAFLTGYLTNRYTIDYQPDR